MQKRLFVAIGVALMLASGCDSNPPGEDAGMDTSVADTAVADTNSPDTGECVPPTHLRFTNIGTNTRSELGYSGLVHDIRVNDEAVWTLEVVSCDDDCRRCEVRGPVANAGVNNRRCVNDTRIECTDDAACGAGGFCRYILGPPLSTNRFTGATCAVVYYENEPGTDYAVRGVVDLRTGRTDFSRLRVVSANNSAGGACPVCVGDPTPNDGEAMGTCEASPLPETDPTANTGAGNNCDSNAFGSEVSGSYSFDCTVSTVVPVFNFFLENYSTGGTTWAVDAERPPCTNPLLPPGTQCWCGLCEGTTDQVCQSDFDCPGSSRCGYLPGVCSAGELAPCGTDADCTSPNTCVQDVLLNICAATTTPCCNTLGGDCAMTGLPVCDSGACGALLPMPGAPLPTTPNICSDGMCGWDEGDQLGTCTSVPLPASLPIGCFPGPDTSMAARGSAEVRDGAYFVRLGGLGCLAPTYSNTTDFSVGLPGPAAYTNSYRFELEYRE